MNDTKKFNVLHIQSDSALRGEQIILGAAYICRNDNNPVEILEMLGLTDDLQDLRRSRRHRRDGVTQEVQR